MAINIKELTKRKSMKMTDEDVSKVVSNYMSRIILEHIEWTIEEANQLNHTLLNYLDEKKPKMHDDPKLSSMFDMMQYHESSNDQKQSYELDLDNIDQVLGAA